VVKFWQKRACNYANPFMRENTRGFRRKTVNLHVELVSDESKGILARIDANKGIGVDNLTPARLKEVKWGDKNEKSLPYMG
jgi:hypothetical protein